MEPPRIDPDKLDFSQFHDLMHRPFTAECRSMYGGWRNHLQLWWEFMASPWLCRRTRCRIGWHQWLDGWSKDLGECRVCRNCWRRRER